MGVALTIADARPPAALSDGSYVLQTLPPGDLIVTTLAGFFTPGQVAVYAREAEALIARCRSAHDDYRILIDISKCAIQTQDVTAAFGRHVARVPRSRRVAVVTRRSIIRMQIRRIVARPELAVFDQVGDALSWLNAA